MNKNQRMLPHLNTCFLQKKAYDVHLKKIDYIRQSLRTSISKKQNSVEHSPARAFIYKSDHKMSTIQQIKEEVLPRPNRSSPWERRRQHQCTKQNLRLIRKLQNCCSTIKRTQIQTHMARSKEILNRISRFKIDPQTHKTQLKSVHSLNILDKSKVRSHLDMTSRKISVSNSRYRQSRSLASKQSKQSSEISFNSRDLLTKKHSYSKFMTRRNQLKVKNHISTSNTITKAMVKLNILRANNTSQIKQRTKTESPSLNSKSRCFTTELQNYH